MPNKDVIRQLRKKRNALTKALYLNPELRETLYPAIENLTEQILSEMDPQSREANIRVRKRWAEYRRQKRREDEAALRRAQEELRDTMQYIEEEGLGDW